MKRFWVDDIVIHKDYPDIKGRIAAKAHSQGVLLVVWQRPRPSFFGDKLEWTSRHIPSALLHVS